jgi:hypothetical protein
MRRKDKQINDIAAVKGILTSVTACRLVLTRPLTKKIEIVFGLSIRESKGFWALFE